MKLPPAIKGLNRVTALDVGNLDLCAVVTVLVNIYPGYCQRQPLLYLLLLGLLDRVWYVFIHIYFSLLVKLIPQWSYEKKPPRGKLSSRSGSQCMSHY